MTKRQITIGLSIIIALVQLFDILIHIATNQAEPLRILSNLIILTWLGSLVSDRFLKRLRPFGFGVIALYLMLNSVFLAQEGIVNSANGEPRFSSSLR